MFTDQFEAVETAKIAASIKENGFFYFENALTEQYVEQLLDEVDFNSIQVNKNDVGAVTSGTQRFLAHCLAKSQRAYDLITCSKVLEVCNTYFTERYQLTNHQFCQTCNTLHMPWHTDNNLLKEGKLHSKHSMPGLLFLFYLSEDNYSPFQLVKGSHCWSQNYDHEIFVSDHWVETHHSDDILTFTMQKGGVILCDIHALHRAKPFHQHGHKRNILLFQVDQIGQQYIGHGQQNLVNTAFIDNFSPELASYLGFGVRRDYPAFPNSSVATLRIPDLLRLQQQLLPLTLQAVTKDLVKLLFPGERFVVLKRLLWNLKSGKKNL